MKRVGDKIGSIGLRACVTTGRDARATNTSAAAFTLLELLAAMAILAMIVGLLFAAFSQASRGWMQAENRVETFVQARAALDYMSRELSQAIATTNISFLGTHTSVAFVAPINTDLNDVDLEEVVYQRGGPFGTTLERQVTPYSAGAAWNFYTLPQNWPATTDPASTASLADNVVLLTFDYVGTNGITMPSPNPFPSIPSWWNSTALPGFAWSGVPAATTISTPEVMTNRTPAGVQITIGTVDSRSAERLKAILQFGTPAGQTNSANITPYTNMIKQVTKYFTTFVAIPNRQP